MRFVWTTALKDLQRRRRDLLALAGWVGTPIVMTLTLYVVFGSGGGATPHGRLLVADEDDSIASRMLSGAFGQGKLAEMIAVEKVDRAAGRRRIEKGDGSALLVIPKGFGGAVLRSEPATLYLVKNPAQTILPGIIEEALSIMADGVFYLQTLAADQLRTFALRPPAGQGTFPDLVVSMVSVTINRLIGRLRSYLDPRLIELETKVIEEKKSTQWSFAGAFFPAMTFLGLLFMAQGLSADLWREQMVGTLRRAAASPQGLAPFLAGKLIGVALLVGVVAMVGLAMGRWILKVPVANPPAALLWAMFSGAMFYLLIAMVQMHASTARTGNILGSAVMLPLSMLGGCFFPFEMMPPGLAAIGRMTPNGWAVGQFQALLAGSVVPARLATGAAVLGAFGVLAFFLSLRRLRRIL